MNTIIKTNGKRSLINPFINELMDIEHLFDGVLPAWKNRAVPAVNVSENEKQYLVDVIAPGFKKDDFKVIVDEEGMLTISGEVSKETKNENEEYSRREYSCNSFARTFYLPDNVKAENIEASYSDGILKLQIPKTEPVKKPATTIQIK